METFGVEGLARTLMIEPRIVKSGQFKDVGSPFRELTDQDKAYLQSLTDDMYAQFVEAVSQGRGIPLEKMPSLAEGRIFTGKQAKEAGLVDELGNLYTAIDLARSLAGLPKDAKVSWPEEPTPFERFFAKDRASLMAQFWQDLPLTLPLWKLDLVTASQIH
jgi:protease-4